MRNLEGIKLVRDPARRKRVGFALAFAVTRDDLDRLSALLGAGAEGDAVLWFAYPKRTSKSYRCEFNRDAGWDVLRHAGFDTVRAVSIDVDWSALRFRRTQYIRRQNAFSLEARR